MAWVRPVLLPLAVSASLSPAFGCSNTTSTSPTLAGDYDDAAPEAEPDEAGSVADCMNAGGTCQTFETPCPVLQQNTALCGSSVMICCLPPEDAAPYLPPVEAGADTGPSPMPEAGPVEASASDAGGG